MLYDSIAQKYLILSVYLSILWVVRKIQSILIYSNTVFYSTEKFAIRILIAFYVTLLIKTYIKRQKYYLIETQISHLFLSGACAPKILRNSIFYLMIDNTNIHLKIIHR